MSVVTLIVLHTTLANQLTREDYGILILVEASSLIASLLILGGIPPISIRMLRLQLINGRSDHALNIARASLITMILFSLLLLIIIIVCIRPEFGIELPAGITHWLPWIFCWGLCTATLRMVSEIARGYEMLGMSYVIGGQSGGFGVNLLMLVAVTVLPHVYNPTAPVVITLLIGVMAICAIPSVLILLKITADGASHQTAMPSHMPWKAIIGASLPLLVQQIVAHGIPEMDTIFLGSFSSPEELALYGIAKKLVFFAVVPLMLVNHAIQPFVAELYAQKRHAQLSALVQGTASFAAAPGLIYICALVVAPKSVIALTFGEGFTEAASPMRFLAVGSGVYLLSGSCGLVQIMTGHERSGMWISLSAGTAYLIAAPGLIANYGIIGAALGAAGLQVLTRTSTVLILWYNERIWTGVTVSRRVIYECLGLLLKKQSPPVQGPVT